MLLHHRSPRYQVAPDIESVVGQICKLGDGQASINKRLLYGRARDGFWRLLLRHPQILRKQAKKLA